MSWLFLGSSTCLHTCTWQHMKAVISFSHSFTHFCSVALLCQVWSEKEHLPTGYGASILAEWAAAQGQQ